MIDESPSEPECKFDLDVVFVSIGLGDTGWTTAT